MERMLRWCLLLAVLVLLMPMAIADDDEDDGGATLDPPTQWRFACQFWDKREYDDAAALMISYAGKNPDEPNVLEARWRVYCVFRDYRPKPERRKAAYEAGMNDCDRWRNKYNTSNPERAAAAMWYRAVLLERETGRPAGIGALQELLKKFPDASYNDDAAWTLAEWLREAGRVQEAIPYYTLYRKIVGYAHEYSALAAFREGNIYMEMGNKDNAILAYKEVLNGKYHWGWGQVHWGSLDAGRRLRKVGEEELARSFFLKIVDNCDKNWDVTKQAMAELGAPPGMSVLVYPHIYPHYTTSKINIDGQTKLTLVRDINVLVRPSYVNKETAFKGTVTIIPKVDMDKTPGTMKADDAAGKKAYTAEVATETGGDWWFNFTQAPTNAVAPDDLVITRKWEKKGNTWGEFTLRIQSRARWHLWINLPNNKTNTNNLNMQPNEVNDNGKTFRWYDWYDLSQGMTIKFPIEVGANVAEYYPRIRLEHNANGWYYRDNAGNGKEATFDMKEMTIKVTGEREFPYNFQFPANVDVIMEEISK